MTNQETIVYTQAQIAAAVIKAAGMLCENLEEFRKGECPMWSGEDFDNLIVEYGLHHNALITAFQESRG